jgi:hypothetical protein
MMAVPTLLPREHNIDEVYRPRVLLSLGQVSQRLGRTEREHLIRITSAVSAMVAATLGSSAISAAIGVRLARGSSRSTVMAQVRYVPYFAGSLLR